MIEFSDDEILDKQYMDQHQQDYYNREKYVKLLQRTIQLLIKSFVPLFNELIQIWVHDLHCISHLQQVRRSDTSRTKEEIWALLVDVAHTTIYTIL